MAAELLSPEPVCMAVEAYDSSQYLDFQLISPQKSKDVTGQLYAVEKLTAGSSIQIDGTVPEKCSGFYVNLRSGEDIALHINPRFDQNYLARNAKINKIWGHEESQLLQSLPFSRGQDFILEILVSPTDYMVSVNGLHMFSFSHRSNYNNVRMVQVSEEVIVSRFLIIQSTFYPSTQYKPLDLPLKKFTKCPIVARIGRLEVGDIIEVTAKIHALPHAFYLNLQAGFHSVPHPIIAYHLVARYVGAWQVALNSWNGGRWNEELTEKLPTVLLPGETFRLVISCLPSGFQTSVSGKLLKTLPYRVPLATSSILVVQGDLNVFSVNSSCVPPSGSIFVPPVQL